jgi:hypothetical protein
MEKLLQWAVNHTDQNALAEQAAAIRRGEALPDPKRYDPKVLEAILGKDDATRMKGNLHYKKKKFFPLKNVKLISLFFIYLLIQRLLNVLVIPKTLLKIKKLLLTILNFN